MFWTKTLIPTLKETPQEAEGASHQLMLRAGLIRMLVAGVYSYLPLGLRVLNNIERIIRQEMDAAGAAELLLPALQPQELWDKSGRSLDMGEVMIRFIDRRGRKMCLGPTHEEAITDLVKNQVSSYKDLPLLLYQIQTKFRDELRPRFGLVRGCEFIMKDAYSFDQDEAGLEKNYRRMFLAYQQIFKRCGLEALSVEADSGVMGGSVSHEFMVPASIGEDVLYFCAGCKTAYPAKENAKEKCPKCQSELKKLNSLEVAHIFKLGTKYSSILGAKFSDAQGKLQPIIMGCYGIGVSRLLPAIIEQNHDAAGIIWPEEVGPYRVIILALDTTEDKIMREAFALHDALEKQGIAVLLDDRNERAGVKFKDADLLGIGLQVIIGRQFLEKDSLELKVRRSLQKAVTNKETIEDEIKKIIHGKRSADGAP